MKWQDQKKDVFIYFDNGQEAYAAFNALSLKECLKIQLRSKTKSELTVGAWIIHLALIILDKKYFAGTPILLTVFIFQFSIGERKAYTNNKFIIRQ